MSRSDADRLDDISEAIAAIYSHLEHGPLTMPVVFDAVRIRLLEIGEAAKTLGDDLTSAEPDIPWKQIARSRDNLAHHYFTTELEIVRDTVNNDLAPLLDAVARLRAGIATTND